MARWLLSRLTYANVVSTLCLFLVLGGGAYAATRITGREIVNGSVRSADLRNNDVRGKDVRNGTISSRHVKNRSLLSSDFEPGSLPVGARGPAGPRGPNGSPDTGDQIRSKLGNAGGDLSGPYSNVQIVPGGVKTDDIEAGAVGRAQLAKGGSVSQGGGSGAVGREELTSGGTLGSVSFFEFSVPAGGCTTKVFAVSDAGLGEILLAYPQSGNLGAGVYMTPTLVAQAGEVAMPICNTTGSAVTIPFGTFFEVRLVG